MIANLKRVLFGGYSTESVAEYIAKLNEEFSRKVLESNEENQRRVRELEKKISDLKKQNLALISQKDEIAQALIDAHLYAKQIRSEAEAARQEEALKEQAQYEFAKMQIERMNTEIEDFQRYVAKTLAHINEEMRNSEILGDEKRRNLESTVAKALGQSVESENDANEEVTK